MNNITKFILKHGEEEVSNIAPYVGAAATGAITGGGIGLMENWNKRNEVERALKGGAGILERGELYDAVLDDYFKAYENQKKLETESPEVLRKRFGEGIGNLKGGYKNIKDILGDKVVNDMVRDSEMNFRDFDREFAGKMEGGILDNSIFKKHMNNNALKKLLLGSVAGLGGVALANNLNTGKNNE